MMSGLSSLFLSRNNAVSGCGRSHSKAKGADFQRSQPYASLSSRVDAYIRGCSQFDQSGKKDHEVQPSFMPRSVTLIRWAQNLPM